MAGIVFVAPSAYAAGTPSLVKEASVETASPGDSFSYRLVPSCSGLQEGCVNAVLTDVVPPEIDVTALPPSTGEYTVAHNPATRTLTVTFTVPLPSPPNPPGSVGLTAGSSFNLDLGVQVPEESQLPDGSVISNTSTLSSDGAPPVSATADVGVVVPRVVTSVATKSWSDGSAVAGSSEAGSMILGVRNASSSSAQVSALTIQDQTPAVFDKFDVTGVGPATFPAGADRVTVLACTVVLSACTAADYQATAAQTGPALTLPVPAADVTGLRFVFTNSAGTTLPYGATGGSVQVGTALRDTLGSTGNPYQPAIRDDVQNCITPSGTDPVLGTVAGDQACTAFSVQPAQATIAVSKAFFSDTDGNFGADGNAVVGLNSPARRSRLSATPRRSLSPRSPSSSRALPHRVSIQSSM